MAGFRSVALAAAMAAACGPSMVTTGEDLGAVDAGGEGPGGGGSGGGQLGPVGSVTGTVWAPGNAPGLVPGGQEIPVSGALISLSMSRPADMPSQVYCDPCVDTLGDPVLSDARGRFRIDAAPGDYWLTIQKGQWRVDRRVTIEKEQTVSLTDAQSTLPSIHDPANGMYIPRIAVADGLWDDIEDILGKMGLGQVDAEGNLVGSSVVGRFDVYRNYGGFDLLGTGEYGVGEHDDIAVGTLGDLIGDLDRMLQYHLIFVPCSDGPNSDLFTNPRLRQNIEAYVAAGGKFYVTDWSSEWEDVVYPDFIQFSADHDTKDPSAPNEGDGVPGYTSKQARAVDQDLAAWLDGQTGPLVSEDGFGTYQVGTMDAATFAVEGNWNHIEQLGNVRVGVDDEGLDVYQTPRTFVMGDWTDGEGPVHPLTLTFEPAGCGRVLYSTYHTVESPHPGLVAQERVLLYLIMEIGVCKAGPIIQ